ncbi:MAG: DNA-directed RNA polymerase subunit beta, partial [Coriobacteriales bacterium]
MAEERVAVSRPRYHERRNFAKIPEVMEPPNLIAVQTESFRWLLGEGLDEAFEDVSPIESKDNKLMLEFGKHEFGDPKHSIEECKEKNITYQASLLVDARFVNKETGEVKEQKIFLGDFPLMTDSGTFIIN